MLFHAALDAAIARRHGTTEFFDVGFAGTYDGFCGNGPAPSRLTSKVTERCYWLTQLQHHSSSFFGLVRTFAQV